MFVFLLLLVMLRVCWFSVLVVGWCSKGCRLWLFGLDPTGNLDERCGTVYILVDLLVGCLLFPVSCVVDI